VEDPTPDGKNIVTDPRHRLRQIRQVFETPLVKAGAFLISRLPRGVVVRLAQGLGAVAYAISPKLRRVGRANLDLVFGSERTDQEKRRILRKSFENFSLVLLDLFWFSRNPRERILKYMRYGENADWLFCKKAQICLTGHMGNWELGGRAVSSRGTPLASVALPLKNAAVDALLNQARESTGQTVIPRQGAVKAMLKFLRQGGKVAMLLDHNTLPSEGGVFLDFFGLPATVSVSTEALAFRTKAEILFVFCMPCKDGSYLTQISGRMDASTLSEASDRDRALTQHITRVYEKAIRQYPEQWLWTYKRWKYIRPGDDPARYPFYAKPLKDHQL